MINIRVLDDIRVPLMTDVETEFAKIVVNDTENNRNIIKEIDGAEYFDTRSFIDRFGDKVPIEYLSTGCKAALLVENTELDVDVRECGHNAISTILRNCRNGNITILELDNPFMYDMNKSTRIDASLDGYRFTDIIRLNYYISNECPDTPNFSLAGVEKL